jgi:hypothetical protein
LLGLQRAFGNQAVGHLLHTQHPLGTSLQRLIQRVPLSSPPELRGKTFKDVTSIKKLFSEGSKTYLVDMAGKDYVLKLGSEDARAEVNTALLANKLGVPAVSAGVIEYTEADADNLHLGGDADVLDGLKEKMRKEARREKSGKGYAVLMEYVQGVTLSAHLGIGEGQETIPKGGSQKLLDRLKQKNLDTFFRDLGQIAAFDIIVANTDRFALTSEHNLYAGGLPKGNTGNFLLNAENRAISIDMDIGIAGEIAEPQTVDGLKEKFADYIQQLKSKNYAQIVKAVLLALSEGEEEKELHGALANFEGASGLIGQGIDMVLERVRSLKGEDLQSISETWAQTSEAYGNYVLSVLKTLR